MPDKCVSPVSRLRAAGLLSLLAVAAEENGLVFTVTIQMIKKTKLWLSQEEVSTPRINPVMTAVMRPFRPLFWEESRSGPTRGLCAAGWYRLPNVLETSRESLPQVRLALCSGVGRTPLLLGELYSGAFSCPSVSVDPSCGFGPEERKCYVSISCCSGSGPVPRAAYVLPNWVVTL